jgi:hypothetical protein
MAGRAGRFSYHASTSSVSTTGRISIGHFQECRRWCADRLRHQSSNLLVRYREETKPSETRHNKGNEKMQDHRSLDEPLLCPDCGHPCKSAAGLAAHARHKHGPPRPKPTGIEKQKQTITRMVSNCLQRPPVETAQTATELRALGHEDAALALDYVLCVITKQTLLEKFNARS